MKGTLQGKVAVVTGGSRGIGSAICLRLAKLGAFVYVNYSSSPDAAQSVLDTIKGEGGDGDLLHFDVSDREAVTKALGEVVEEKGAVHILVNNAGITKDTLLARMKEEDWDRVMDIDLKGVFNCTQAVLRPMMKARWGRVINIGSVVGSMGNAGQANYAAAKAGLMGFSKSLAREVAARGITVNVVAPGFIETDMTKDLPEKIKEQLLAQIPAGRMGSVEEVAAAVAFLASDSASYITGHVLHVNGGLLCE